MFLVSSALFPCACVMCFTCFSSMVFQFFGLLLSTSDGLSIFIRAYRTEYRRVLRAQYLESCDGIALPRPCEWYRRFLPRGPRLIQNRNFCHFAFELLCHKEEVFFSARWFIGHHCPWSVQFVWQPLPSAGKWIANFAVFRKLVLPFHTLFFAIEVAGHIVVNLDVLLISRFVHGQLLHFFFDLPLRTRAVPCNLQVRTEFGNEDEKVLFGVPVAPCGPRWLICPRLVMKATEQPG